MDHAAAKKDLRASNTLKIIDTSSGLQHEAHAEPIGQGQGIVASAIMLAIAILCLATAGAGPVVMQFETSPLSGDTAQQRWLRHQAEIARETNRLSVVLPKSAVQAPSSPDVRKGGRGATAPTTKISGGESFGSRAITVLICSVLAILILQKLRSGSDSDGLTDEKAFGEFLSGFRAGPKPAAGSRKVQKAEQHPEPDLPSQEQPDALTTQARQLFFATTPEQLLAIWSLLQAIQAESSSNQQRIMLSQVCTHLQSLKYAASFPEVLPVWQLTSVTEGLAQQLVKHPGEITVKRIECIAAALQLLTELCRPAVPADLITAPPIRLMVVDDDLISRRAIAHALAKAFRQPDIASNGEAALAQISKISYDVIFLDILMPGLDGFELNTKIRETSVNQFTPVVFVTSQSDALTRERAELCCGDLIIKPFLTFEITLTAMVLATRARFNTLRKDLTGESVKQEHARTAQAELVESVA